MNTRYSDWCKIVDPNSEYYGQVFKVDIISVDEIKFVRLIINNKTPYYTFSQIQFCVTKTNSKGKVEPVKIGEEYVCIGDLYCGYEIFDFIIFNNTLKIYYHKEKTDNTFYLDMMGDFTTFKPLHPTNKIEFMECDTCRAKLGSPILCRGCLHNRNLINTLQTQQTNNIGIK